MNVGAANTLALAALAIGWLAVASSLLGGLVRRRPQDLRFRVMGVGLLVMLTGGLLSQFAAVRQWPHDQRLVIDGIAFVLGAAGVGCVVSSIVARARARSDQL